MTAIPTQHAVALGVARKLTPSREILPWMTQSEDPKAVQASECSELIDPRERTAACDAQAHGIIH